YIDQSELPLLQEKYDVLKVFNGKERYLMIRKDLNLSTNKEIK
ncbi:MAG: hypothetical protein RLZZ292_1658, partial [Bacteroidota bacterium]